jgi:hypothetical protein
MSEYELALQEYMAKLKGGFAQSMDNVNNNLNNNFTGVMGGDANTQTVDELTPGIIKDTDINNTAAEREALLAGFAPVASNLGLTNDPVFMPGRTPTIPDVVPTGMDYAGSGQPNMNAPVIDRQQFNKQFAALSEQEKRNVEEIMANMDDLEKANFAAGLTGAPLSGFAVQDEMLDYTRGY